MLINFKNITLITLFFLKISFLVAQSIPYTWQDKDFDEIKNFEMLVDKGYTFEQILTDSTLHFQKNPEKYKFEKDDYCWFRFSIQNNSVYTKQGYLRLIPHLENTLYYYNFENKKWEMLQKGIALHSFEIDNISFPIYIQAEKTTVFYIKSRVKELHSENYPVQLFANIYSTKMFENNQQFKIISCLVVGFAIFLFIIYNLYIYIFLQDKIYFYYIIMSFAGILYIIGFSGVLSMILPIHFYNLQVQPTGLLYYYTLDDIITVLFIWLSLFGYVQFARTYLQLSTYFEFWDKVLKYSLILFSCFQFLFMVSCFFKSFFIYVQMASISNLLVGIIALLIVYISFHSYLKGYKIGRYFLIANLFPLLTIFSIAIYIFIYEYNTRPIQLLPHIALVSQTLTFAIALVARINLLKDELKEKQLQAEILEKENERTLARNQYIELENEYIMAEIAHEVNQKAELQQKLEANQRELTANTLYLYQKNEMLNNLQKQIQNLSFKETTAQNREGIREIKSTIKNDFYLENDWDKFKIHFEQVHPNFFKELNEKYPTLTPNEIRLVTYYHLNMTAKEIATLLNINPTSVHRAKSRLNKKMEAIDKER